MPLDQWLVATDRDPSPSTHFDVQDVGERVSPEPEVIRDLAESLLESRTSLEFLKAVAPLLGLEMIDRRIEQPSQISVLRGDFGEVLTEVWLSEHDKLDFPYHKNRHRILPNQTQPGTDLIGIERTDGTITRLHMVETKLRTTANTRAGCDAYNQHIGRSSGDVDAHLMFMLEQLFNDGHPLWPELIQHLRTRNDVPNDAYDIALVYDRDHWSQRTLERLDEAAGSLSPLRVHVFQLAELRVLVDSAFAELGAIVIDDIDDTEDDAIVVDL
jgi:hypothetical protein